MVMNGTQNHNTAIAIAPSATSPIPRRGVLVLRMSPATIVTAATTHSEPNSTLSVVESHSPPPAITETPNAGWAIREVLWKPHETLLITKCAEDLGRALREEYITDPQGRRVRAKHAARMRLDRDEGEQGALWDDIRTASHEHLRIAFQQRRQGIVGDCHRLKIDVDSYNENRNPIEPIQMSFEFTNDLLEMEAVPV